MEIKIKAQTVIANEGGFEPHPESYTPRVFAKVPTNAYSNSIEPTVYKVYEILGNGQAVDWPTLPPTDCGFDYWSFLLMSIGNVTMVRATRSVPQADGYSESFSTPNIPSEVWKALKEFHEDAERESGTPSWIGEIDGKRYSGLGKPESGHLSHLPEGSH
jgi:hypothetical protein